MIVSGYLTENIKLTKLHDHTAAGTTDVTDCVTVDMAGYDGALFFTSFSVAAADNSLKLQQSSDDGSSDAYSDLEGSGVVSGASPSYEDVWLDITNPGKRYLKPVVVVDTSSTVESVWCIQYRARSLPITNTVSGTIIGEQTNAPAEGTA